MHRTPLSTALLAGPARCVSGRGDERRTARLRRLGWRRRPRRRRCARARRQRRWEGGSHAQGTSARQPAWSGRPRRKAHAPAALGLCAPGKLSVRVFEARKAPGCAPVRKRALRGRHFCTSLRLSHAALRAPQATQRPRRARGTHCAPHRHPRRGRARRAHGCARATPNPRAPSWLTGCLPFSARAALLRRRGLGGSSPSPGLGRAS